MHYGKSCIRVKINTLLNDRADYQLCWEWEEEGHDNHQKSYMT